MSAPSFEGVAVVLSCEHGGNHVPEAYAPLFAGREQLLQSHRGWDPGTLELGQALAKKLGAPVVTHTVTRLLVETNRSLGHKNLFSEVVRPLDAEQRREVVDRFYRPHRERVEGEIRRRIDAGREVLHLGCHSFTPELDGAERRFDVGWLYDPARTRERAAVDRLVDALRSRRPDLRQRRNAPYLGKADGLTTSLRRMFPADRYLGIELEVNQRFPLGPEAPWQALVNDLGEAILEATSFSRAG